MTLDKRERARCAEAMKAPNAIFVFGSNYAGRHGKGAAHTARTLYGAVPGHGEGHTGRCYAIPTKGYQLQPLSLSAIEHAILLFLGRAAHNRDLTYVITRIGCGLAGYPDAEIAPLFKTAPPNCLLPEGWR